MIVGFQNVTGDLALGTSGEPQVVYGFHILSGADGAGSVVLRNGTTTGGTAIVTEEGTQAKGETFNFGGVGVIFPSGCFVDLGTNTTSVAVFYQSVV